MLKEDGNLDIRVHDNRYQLQRKLGRGTFGVVYQASDLVAKRDVAMKLEYSRGEERQLGIEAEIYRELKGCPGIPEVYWYGQEGDFNVLVFELLGPTFGDLLNYCGGKFSLKTVLMLADQLVPRLQRIHKKYIHKDIKPENIMMGTGRKGNDVYVTDVGLGEEYTLFNRDPEWEGDGRLVGTSRYASIRAHAGQELWPRDDLESLGYVLVYMLNGSLPWQGMRAKKGENIDQLVGAKKRATSIQDLCAGLPKQFVSYFDHIANLPHRGKPDYAYLIRLFRAAFADAGFEYDHVFDWTILKFLEHLKEEEGKSSHEINSNK